MNVSDQLILIVDDVSENIQVALNVLKPLNTSLSFARSGEEALNVIKSRKPNLILLDVMMPNIDGFTLCKQLKSDFLYNEIPIIFLTAKRDIEDIVKGFEYGAIDYITKPFNKRELFVRVKTHLQNIVSQERLKKQIQHLLKERDELKLLLIQQSKMASLGEMLSSITHQWKQPLNVISMNTATGKIKEMMKENPDLNLLEHFENIEQQINFMVTTMHDFKNFFQPEQNKQTFSLIESSYELINLFSKNFVNNNIILNLQSVDGINVEVFGFENMYKQALINIVGNAADAIAEAGSDNRNIDILCDRDDHYGIVTITNYAGRIPDKIIGKIFDQFFSTKESEGTGIGLSMAKQIVEELQGGSLSVKNIDDGVRFTIKLPLTENEPVLTQKVPAEDTKAFS